MVKSPRIGAGRRVIQECYLNKGKCFSSSLYFKMQKYPQANFCSRRNRGLLVRTQPITRIANSFMQQMKFLLKILFVFLVGGCASLSTKDEMRHIGSYHDQWYTAIDSTMHYTTAAFFDDSVRLFYVSKQLEYRQVEYFEKTAEEAIYVVRDIASYSEAPDVFKAWLMDETADTAFNNIIFRVSFKKKLLIVSTTHL